MNTRILFMAAAVVGLSSCSTMYRSGQTPDDVYYSPAPAYQQRVASPNNSNQNEYTEENDTNEYLSVQTEQDRSAYNSGSEDNYLRMKVRNPSMWSSLDYYGGAMYSPYSYGTGFGFGMGYYNPYSFNSPYFDYAMGFGWGGMYSPFYNPFYNPYYGYGGYGGYYGHSYYPGGVYYGGKSGTVRPAGSYSPRTTNLGNYGRTRNAELINNTNKPVRVFRNGNSSGNNYINPGSSSSGNTSPRRSFNTQSDSRPSRTFDNNNNSNSSPRYSPSSNSGSSGNRSSGSSIGGSAPSRAPGRGGR